MIVAKAIFTPNPKNSATSQYHQHLKSGTDTDLLSIYADITKRIIQ